VSEDVPIHEKGWILFGRREVGKMTDSEKIALIDKMISEFWQWVPADREKQCADSLVVTIAAVIDFGKD
jgi:hypothetical protein